MRGDQGGIPMVFAGAVQPWCLHITAADQVPKETIQQKPDGLVHCRFQLGSPGVKAHPPTMQQCRSTTPCPPVWLRRTLRLPKGLRKRWRMRTASAQPTSPVLVGHLLCAIFDKTFGVFCFIAKSKDKTIVLFFLFSSTKSLFWQHDQDAVCKCLTGSIEPHQTWPPNLHIIRSNCRGVGMSAMRPLLWHHDHDMLQSVDARQPSLSYARHIASEYASHLYQVI